MRRLLTTILLTTFLVVSSGAATRRSSSGGSRAHAATKRAPRTGKSASSRRAGMRPRTKLVGGYNRKGGARVAPYKRRPAK